VWQAIIISTLAGEKGGLGALSLVNQARELLERAEALDPDVLDGSVYTSLGSLYYQVPGWPLGFGNDDKAESYLKKALTVNPDGIDPNYFYGDYLLQEKAYSEAEAAFRKALAAPRRDGRPIADAGRRSEIEAALNKLKSAQH
jgi:tetratricopeptide (TPR) repeat protein